MLEAVNLVTVIASKAVVSAVRLAAYRAKLDVLGAEPACTVLAVSDTVCAHGLAAYRAGLNAAGVAHVLPAAAATEPG